MTTMTDAAEKAGHSGFTVGHLLRRRREERGAPIEEIAKETRIPTRYLVALEDGVMAELPGLTYAVGFVKAYARWLGLSPDMVAEQFKAEAAHHLTPRRVTELTPLDERKAPSMRLIVLSILGVGAVVIVASLVRQGDLMQTVSQLFPSVASSAPKPQESITIPDQTAQAALPPLASPTPPPSAAAVPTVPTEATPSTPEQAAPTAVDPSSVVILTAREDAWVKITEAATGKTVLQRILSAGNQYVVPSGSRQLLWTGRAGALDVTVGGAALPPLGGPNDVVRDIELTATALAARNTPAR